jgi:hypothetical protein
MASTGTGDTGGGADRDGQPRAKAGTGSLDLQQMTTIGGIALVLFTLLKAYAAAKFSLTTAAALLTTAPLNVFLGTMVSYSYAIFPLLALGALAWTWHSYRTRGWTALNRIAVFVAVIALLVSPWSYLWPPAVALGVLVLARWAMGRFATRLAARRTAEGRAQQGGTAQRRGTRLPSGNRLVELFFLAAATWVILRSLTNLWLPVEVLVYQEGTECTMSVEHVVRTGDNKQLTVAETDGCRVTVGHVLSVEDTWATVVRADDRGLVKLPADSIRYRELCHLTGVQPESQRPLLWVLYGRSYWSPNTSCGNLVHNLHGAELDRGSLPGQPSG